MTYYPPPIKLLKEFDDNISQTVDIKGIEPVTTLSSPPENSVIIPVISEEKEMVTEDVMTSKTIAEKEIQLDVINIEPQPRGGVTHIGDDQETVLTENEESTTVDQDDVEALDWNDIIQEMDDCIEQLGWTEEQARKYVQATYGKKSRLKLTDEELLELLDYFRNLVQAKE
jgi:hypothetical protein